MRLILDKIKSRIGDSDYQQLVGLIGKIENHTSKESARDALKKSLMREK